MTFRRTKGLAVVMAAAALASCDSSRTPTAPSPVLGVSQSSVALSRTESSPITATSTLAGATTDVTALASWQSSNDQVATVAGGLVTGVGPGTATVTLSHSGETRTVSVTVRRRVYLSGSITVTALNGQTDVDELQVFVNQTFAGYHSTSSGRVELTIEFGNSDLGKVLVSPGTHSLALLMTVPSGNYAIRFPAASRILDFDTGEQVGTVSLENRQGAFTKDARPTWSVALDAFTS